MDNRTCPLINGKQTVHLVCFVHLADLVCLLSFFQPNKLNRPNKQDRPSGSRALRAAPLTPRQLELSVFCTAKSARAANRYSKTVNKHNKEVYYDARTVESVS